MLEYFMNEIVFKEEKMKTRENKRIVKLDLILFQNCPYGHIIKNVYKKSSTHSLFGAWSFLLVHIRFYT